ncbi:DUF4386 family protein [Caldalkalibacillus salinus]|uniref:DUF4386 family protein n=1 Tax=Caldalkalibacillus salinus TaxID=2803787 RepID=UPI001921B9F7|nr:DUF4386 family protein [Caldalkalibacillus salinus]
MKQTRQDKVTKTGGLFAILVGLSYLLVGLTFALQPSVLITGTVAEHLQALHQDSTMRSLYFLSWALTGIFAIGAVPMISNCFKQYNEALINWVSGLALIGFAVTIVANLRAMNIKPMMADVYVNGDPLFQDIIPTVDPWLLLDPFGYLTMGAVGLWLLTLNIVSFNDKQFSKVFNVIGLLGAVCLFIGLIGANNPMLSGIASGLGGMVFGPIWFIWMGIIMMRTSEKSVQTTGHKPNRQAEEVSTG